MPYMITANQYRDEWIQEFQRGETYLRETVTKEIQREGTSSAIFSIGGKSSGMVTRGVNGLIPTRNATDRQVTLNLKERHSLENQTKFNVFTAAGAHLRQTMQYRSRMDVAREIDDEIIASLAAATNKYNGGTAITMTFGRLVDIVSELWENDVESPVTFIHSPKSWARLLSLSQFTSSDYVDGKPLMQDKPRPLFFANAYHFMNNGLAGRGTNSALMYAYSKKAVGYAIADSETEVTAGFNDEQAYSWDRATIYHVAGILQQAGVFEIKHDDSTAIT